MLRISERREVEMEVDDAIGTFYVASVEAEDKNNRKETRRHTHLSDIPEESYFLLSGEHIYDGVDEAETVQKVLSKLTKRERYLVIAHLLHGYEYTEIGKVEGKHKSNIMRETNKAVEKFKCLYREEAENL
jgi:DNA-directed RNA polymerase specialized sigma24 family protein